MKVAHDVYAETNPAFGTYALAGFVKAYSSINDDGVDLPMIYLSLPLALSGDLAGTFNGTNKNTGLLEWLERHPRVQIGLAERVNASLDIVTGALRFGCFTQVLAMQSDGRLRLGAKTAKQAPVSRLDAMSAGVVKRAGTLGSWFAMAGSTRNIFGILGLTV